MRFLAITEAVVWATVGVVGLAVVVMATVMAGNLARQSDDREVVNPREDADREVAAKTRCESCDASSRASFAAFTERSPALLESAEFPELETKSIDLKFALAVLAGLDVEPSVWSVSFLEEWARNEGAYAVRYNPLATTRHEPGSSCYNADCVRQYPDFETGVAATVATLKQASFASIVDSLRAATITDRWTVGAALRRWGTMLLADKVASGWAPLSD